MWIYLTLVSALLLGVYDVTKKKALRRNSVMWVLFSTSFISTVLLIPFFTAGSPQDILTLAPKAALVTLSWISGLIGMKLLPLTIASTLKASRPVFVIIFSMIIFGERLNLWQWVGVVTALTALWALSRSSKKEGIFFTKNKGIFWMVIAIISGVCSALYDKYVISGLNFAPMFVECWCNLLITLFMGLVLAGQIIAARTRSGACGITASSGQKMTEGADQQRFKWDWYLLLISVLIVGADTAYFFALAQDGALLSIISLMRRGSVIVTFCLSAVVFKETNIRDKAMELGMLLVGISILVFAE